MKGLFFDIDGTLLDTRYNIPTIPETVIHELNRIRQLGHKCFIASGRPKAMLDQCLLEAPVDGYILFNGGYVEIDGHSIYEERMDPQLAKATCDMLDKLHCDYMIETTHHIYIDPSYRELYDFFSQMGMTSMFSDHFDRDDVLNRTIKIEANVSAQDKDKVESYIRNNFGYVISNDNHGSDHAFEFYPVTISKAIAIKKVLNHYNIPQSESYAFGDGDNDIEMLEYCQYGVAMGNADDHVKAAADIIAPPVWEDGLAKILRTLI